MKKFIWGLIFSTFLLLGQTGLCAQKSDVIIVYPKVTDKVNADSTFLVGSTKPGSTLYINGIKTKVYPLGSFVKVVPLKNGNNTFVLKSTLDGKVDIFKYKVYRKPKQKPLPPKPLKIIYSSISPRKNILYKAGDIIKVKFQGSTGHYAYFKLNGKSVPMRELSSLESKIKGVYEGFYEIKPEDKFKSTRISVVLKGNKSYIKKLAPAKISTMPKKKFLLARCLDEKTTTRKEPAGERVSPLPKDTIVYINGAEGNYYRIALSDKRNVWIKKKDVSVISRGVMQPESDLSKLDIYSDNKNIYLALPMDYKLPVQVNQTALNQLRVDIYGSKFKFENVNYKDEDIKYLKIFQAEKNKLSLVVQPKVKQLWGFDYYYQNDELIIKLKKKPKIDNKTPLKGIVITLDPGHGGCERGAIGPTNIPEKQVNLEISKLLKAELEKAGAKVIMTRTKDVLTPIYSRPKKAKETKSDLLLSIHNNALPDGQDPYEKHGISNFYYHMQAEPLAYHIQKSLVKKMKLKDLGIFKRSFALTRPSETVSVLVECAYMIHPEEYEMLVRPYFQKQIADAIKEGVENFLRENK